MFTEAPLPVNDCLGNYLAAGKVPAQPLPVEADESALAPQSVSPRVWNLCFALVVVGTGVVVVARMGGVL